LLLPCHTEGAAFADLLEQRQAASVTGRHLLRRWLLRERRKAHHQPKTNKQNRKPIRLHKSSDPLTSLQKIYSNLPALSPLLEPSNEIDTGLAQMTENMIHVVPATIPQSSDSEDNKSRPQPRGTHGCAFNGAGVSFIA
jgi:hypothetical protein